MTKFLPDDLTWQPPGLSIKDIELFFKNYPRNKIPLIGTPGEKYRQELLIQQIPKQDISNEYCRYLKDKSSYDSFNFYVKKRNEKYLDIGICYKNTLNKLICKKCNKPIYLNSICIKAPLILNSQISNRDFDFKLIEESYVWHPQCFSCKKCDELLVDLVYCKGPSNSIYCVRHYGELFRPRCNYCDEKFFEDNDCDDDSIFGKNISSISILKKNIKRS